MFKHILLNSEYIESFEINGKSLFILTKEKGKSQLIKIDIKSGNFIKKVDIPFETRQLIIE